MQKLDYIIVGGGMAGILLSEQLRKRGQKILLIDSEQKPSASYIAAGTWNPITFKRFILSWRAEEFLAEMKSQYTELENLLGTKLYQAWTVKKLVGEGQELDLWNKQAQGEMDQFMVPHPKPSNFPEGFYLGEIKQTGRIVLDQLIESYQKRLSSEQALLKEDFNYDAIATEEDGVTYKSYKAKGIIFCEGAHVKNNPFFDWLPLKQAKGDVLTIHAPGLDLNYILKKNIFVLPLGDDQYQVGATYDWKNVNWELDEGAKNELCDKLKTIINVPFVVVHQKAGIRPTSFDRRVIMGQHPEHKRLHVLNGLGTKGVLLGPLAAKEFSENIINGKDIHPEMSIERTFKKYYKKSQ